MKDISNYIQIALGKHLHEEGYDVVDLIPIPTRGDRMVRIRTLEEALDDFDASDNTETISYLVQIKQKISQKNDENSMFSQMVSGTFAIAQEISEDGSSSAVHKPRLDGIYLPNGKLNSSFLTRNAEILLSAGEYLLARNIYKTILQSGERSDMALLGIANTYEAEGKVDEAIKNYEESITYHATLTAYKRLIALLIRQNKDQQAAETIERALFIKDIQPETKFELHKMCGNCWLRAEKTANAEIHFGKALEIDPTSDTVYASLGALHLQSGNILEATRLFQEAVSTNAKNDKAMFGLGSCAYASGDKRGAHDYFVKALDVKLNNPTAIYHLIKCAYEIKSYASAARIVGEYIQVAPVNANLLYSLAGLQFHLGRIDEARATIKQILNLQPNHPGANELLQMTEKYTNTSL